MIQKIKDFLSSVYRISGRASRSEFWKKMLWIFLAFFVSILIVTLIGTAGLMFGNNNIVLLLVSFVFGATLVIFAIMAIVTQVCMMMRRTQDIGWDGRFIVGICAVNILLACVRYFNPFSLIASVSWFMGLPTAPNNL